MVVQVIAANIHKIMYMYVVTVDTQKNPASYQYWRRQVEKYRALQYFIDNVYILDAVRV